jgi:protein O-GlcNAc transferase
MTDSTEPFRLAFARHQAGHLGEAEAAYAEIVTAEPKHVEAWHFWGLVAYQSGRPAEAVARIRRAIELGGQGSVLHVNLAESYRALGQLAEAEVQLRHALRLDPNLPEAHNSLGNVLQSLGRDGESVHEFQLAIRLRPNFPEAHNNLGVSLQARGKLAEAIECYRRATQNNPNYAGAFNNLGVALQAVGDDRGAGAAYLEARRLDPTSAEVHLNLATVHHRQGRLADAVGGYRESIRRCPTALAHNNLGTALALLDSPDEAIACYREAIRLNPDLADAHLNLGSALKARADYAEAEAAFATALVLEPESVKAMLEMSGVRESQGRLDEALRWCDAAARADPQNAAAHLERAHVYRALKRPAEAVVEFREAIRLRPDDFEAYNGLAVLYIDHGRMDEAIECCQAGIERAPPASPLYANLATAVQNLGQLDEAIDYARRSVELNPAGAAEHSNLLYKLNFHPAYDATRIHAEHLRWGQRHADPLTALAAPHSNQRDPMRRLRLGYVSPYFRDHAVNFFSEPILASHDHRQFEVFCYSDVLAEDQVTLRLRAAADHWRQTRSLTDAQLADAVRADAIDILVDLTGHILGSRLLAFARKPAPVQVTYLGYQNTTGMRAMDYRLTDSLADPPGQTDRYYTEKLVRLPRAFFCYRPADEAPAVSPLPALAAGTITLGSFNNYFKVGPAVLDAWFDILARVPGSRLVVLTYPGEYLRKEFARRAGERGIDPGRIALCEKRPRREYFELMSTVDLALDPFPFNGHTTTCDAVWMGVPVVMRAGDCYASRFGASVLANVGLEAMIATSRAQYIETAVEWATEARRADLARLRQQLRPRMATSPLLDFAGFTRNLEAAYRVMWTDWCRGES